MRRPQLRGPGSDHGAARIGVDLELPAEPARALECATVAELAIVVVGRAPVQLAPDLPEAARRHAAVPLVAVGQHEAIGVAVVEDLEVRVHIDERAGDLRGERADRRVEVLLVRAGEIAEVVDVEAATVALEDELRAQRPAFLRGAYET